MLGGADNPNGELPSYITGADNGFPGIIQLNSQLLHTFTSIDRMSQCPTDRNTLSLPLFTLQQLLARISPAITAFKPDVPAAQCILKAFQQT